MAEIERLPGIYLHEFTEKMNYGGNGDIPCFIGVTNNDASGTKIHKFTTFESAAKPINDKKEGGIGATGNLDKDLQNNPLLNVLKRFFEEAELTSSVSESIPYVYVVDVGKGDKIDYWKNSLKISELPHDIKIEAYYGLEYLQGDAQTFLNAMNNSLTQKAKAFNFRYGLITKILTDTKDNKSINNNDIKNLATANKGYNRCYVWDPQIRDVNANTLEAKAVDAYNFGEYVARIAVTPLGEEPGHYDFKNIKEGTFCKRTNEEATDLQKSGVCFGRDELYDDQLHPRINWTIATSYANNPNDRPADCFYQSRRICDDTLTEIYNKCYPFIKARETDRNLVVLQTAVNTIIADRVDKGLLRAYDDDKNPTGSRLSVLESGTEPFELVIQGNLQAIGMIKGIDVEDTITAPPLKETKAD